LLINIVAELLAGANSSEANVNSKAITAVFLKRDPIKFYELVKRALKNSTCVTEEYVTDIQHFLSAADNSFLIIKTSVIELLTPFQEKSLKRSFSK
jgi:hypothetical protein